MTARTYPYDAFLGHWRTHKVALRKATEYAALNPFEGEPPQPGEVYASSFWNGQEAQPCWIRYSVEATDDGGWDVVATVWDTDPLPA